MNLKRVIFVLRRYLKERIRQNVIIIISLGSEEVIIMPLIPFETLPT